MEKRLELSRPACEVRHTVIRVIAAHLNGTAPVSWCGLNFGFAFCPVLRRELLDFSRVASWTQPPDFGRRQAIRQRGARNAVLL